jgi:hypothetical protein
MARDPTFEAALGDALRRLERGGTEPPGEDPAWAPVLAYLAAALGGEPDEEDAVIRWIDERGEACESTRLAQRTAAPIVLRQSLAPSADRLVRILALLRRGVSHVAIAAATGIDPFEVAELGRAAEAEEPRPPG